MRHPLHPAIVHFPVACWSLAVAADFAGLVWGEAAWQWSAGLLAVGCAMALVAMMAGFIEVPRVPDGAALTTLWWHMGLMLTAFCFFSARLFLGLEQMKPIAPNTLSLILDALGFITLAVGGWMGGRLVYGYGVGPEGF